MRLTKSTKNQYLLLFTLFIGSLFASNAQEVAPFTPRLDGGNIEIRGDIIFVGNNILNRASQADPGQANDPYNGTANNNSLWMEYIDIDSDPSTFSSSSAELNITDPACSQVRYAGLYWAATYPNERSTQGDQPFSGTPRIEDWFNIKFQVPGGSYVDLTADTAADPAGQEDDIIYDGYNVTNINNSFKDSPYICYKNVTDLVRGNANPNGEYTVANVRATKGKRNGSSSAGWVMVIIYENPNESGKFISTFDGYAGMSSAAGNVDVAVNGFRTLPSPFPVRARVGVGALEGDRGITNDRLFIRANSTAGYTNLFNGLNPNNNFFNSTITTNGNEVPTRTPFGTNTLGTDLDLFNLNNPSESVLPNNESGATLRFTSTGDGYGSFLAAFSVEIIEPNIVLEKRVEDIAGNDITDGGVNLGQTLDYVLSFRNLGNDHAENYTIRDVLPTNTSFVSFDVSGAPGITASYDATTNEVNFAVPDDLVQIGDPAYTIRLRVKVASNCFDFVDACSDRIQNLAYSTYRGDINSAIITDDPSVSDFDNCGFTTPGATNFLLDDLADCNFTRTVQLCGANTILNAGDGFDSYVWVRDDNNNGQIDGSDTLMNDGDPDNKPSTLLVDDIGTYIVDKIVADPCKGFKEIITVERFGETQTNPIIDYFNDVNSDANPINDIQGEIVQCSVDGDLLPKIFLCGTNDSQPMQINITDAQSLTWERLDETSCTAAPNDCANKNLGCSWNQVASGNNYIADTGGKYRLVISYTNGCFSRFYFDVFQNNLDIQYNNRDIICARDGRIRITNLGSSYGYQLVDHANNTIITPFSAGHGPTFDFGAGENGSYRVEVVQLDGAGDPIPGACIFSTDPIGIRDRDFQVDITTTPANCTVQGSIKIDVLNVRADYTYRLLRPDGTLIDDETAQPDNTHTFTVNPGNYTIETSTSDGCSDSQIITVGRIPNPTVSAVTTANIGCSAGTIELTRTGGQGNPDFLYAIWSKDGVEKYANIASIPANKYQVSSTFDFGWRDDDGDGDDEYISGEDGIYEFVIIDANNCFAFSNPATINDSGATTIDSIDETQPSCSGDNDGALTINVSGGIPPYEYSIDNGVTYQNTPNFVNLSASTYPIRVLDASGCEISQSHSLSQPFPLSASAGVSRDATCDPNGAEVRITNVVGGDAANYQYSFDGGFTYGGATIAILPPGDYTVIASDGACEFPMAVTVEDIPEEPTVTLTPEVSYSCLGEGTITATTDISTYNYTYELDGIPNAPPTSHIFPNVSPGTYTVSTKYSSQIPPTPSLLLQEDFGSGSTIPSPNTNGYTYEDQTPNPPGDGNSNINDFEYSVTSDVVAPFGTWVSPIDHTSGTRSGQGRYLVMNVGTPTPTQVIYSKEIHDIIPGQDLSISFYVMNLLRQGTGGLNPDLTVEIRELGTGNVVQSVRTGAIVKNTGNLDWKPFSGALNPGGNTSLAFVIRSEITGNGGNDFALDDIEIFQVPQVCEMTVETPVTVEAAKVFSAIITGSSNVSCNGQNDASISFEVENFDLATGFDYSLDGGTTWINSTSSPVTTTTPIGAGTQRIDIRKANEHGCFTFVEQTITQPNALIAAGSVTTVYTCANGGATITASVSGGTPNYEYQLEDVGGAAIGGFDFTTNGNNTVFSGLAPDNYLVRVRDNKSCENIMATAITVADTVPVTFTTTSTDCYTGGSSASIQIDVATGNENYTFSINGNPWVTPSPANADTHTFTGLANGSYTINVRDGSGCIGAPETITIDPQLTVTASAPNITACATETNITISAAGGDTNYVYAVIPSGNIVVDSDFSTTNPVSKSVAGDYDVYVRDKGDSLGYCSATYSITIVKDAPIDITATPTDVTCFGGSNGAISIAYNSGGNGPFRYSITGGAPYVTGNSFPNLSAGTYPISVIDANGCVSVPENAIVAQPDQLMADAVQTQDYTCLQLGQITVGGVTLLGGSGDYQYSINGSAWTASTTSSHVFTDLNDGAYSVRVRDANATSCSINLPNIVIDPLPAEPTLTSSVSYNCDGSGNITVTPFDAAYTYILDGTLPGQSGPGMNVFNNVAVGSHTITVDYGRDCTTDIIVIVANGNAFEASITAFENLDCTADASGTITIDADNYGGGGYEYSLDGVTFSGPFFADEQITGLSAQAYSIEVRDVNNEIAGLPNCTETLTQTLTEPASVEASASITEEFTCNNSGATITASAAGGTPTYQYRLEDTSNVVIRVYQGSTTFANVPVGNYIIRAQDINMCDDTIDAAITVITPTVPTFTTTTTACYSGANDASIQVDVTAGNNDYQFSLNGGPWTIPTPATPSTHTFDNLANGTYTIDVRDGYGCSAIQEPITLNPNLTATVDVVDISSCADGNITVNASGGDGNFVYAFVATTTPVTAGDFSPSNTFAMTTGNDGDYDVYVWDNNAVDPHCEYLETVTIDPATPLAFTAIPTDPLCYNGTGSIAVNITSGDSPYTIQIIDLDNGGASDQTDNNVVATSKTYFNLAPGNYTINITDDNGCSQTETPILINNPDELTATIVGITPSACTGDINDFGFQFTTYPSSLGTIEFSDDGGTTWAQDNSTPGTSDIFTGYISGSTVNPSMRTIDGSGNTICRTDLPEFIVPYPLDNLDITILPIVVNCNELQVTVQGGQGTPDYEYTYSEDPANFNPATPIHPWTTPAKGLMDPHTFTGLVPGRTYIFYVRDAAGCVRQSNTNVNDIITVPLEITSTYEPTCDGLSTGSITFTVTDNDTPFGNEFRWEVFEVSGGSPVSVVNSGGNVTYSSPQDVVVTGLPEGNYFIDVTEVDGGVDSCRGASENLVLEELNPITGNPVVLKDITCADPGLIEIQSIFGGGGAYTYMLSSTNFSANIVGTNNPMQVPIADLVDATITPFNVDVSVTDQYGCTNSLGTVVINVSQSPSINTMDVDNCASPISLTVGASNGSAPYLYSIDGGANYVNNNIFNNLTSGTYTVSIIDSNGCTDTDTVAVYPILQADVSLTKLLECPPNANAEITIDVTSGSGNYDYEITNTSGTVVSRTALSNPSIFDTADADDYVITVYDTNTSGPECSRTFNIEVPAAIVPSFTEAITDVSCNGGADGTITLTETNNGINPLSYSISPVMGSFNTAKKTFEGLPAGTYTVTGEGTNDCTFDITNIVIGEPAAITVPDPAIVQFGCSTGNNPNDATITFGAIPSTSVLGGSGNYIRYEFINTTTSTTVQNGPNASYTETDVAGGAYDINVYDDKGCFGTVTTSIAPFDELSPATITVGQSISCIAGANITINAFGSLTDSSTPAGLANYEFRELPSGTFAASNVFTNLAAGNYNFEVRNVNTGCVIGVSHRVNEPNNFEITATTVDVVCHGTDGWVSFAINDPVNPYSGGFTWQIYDALGAPVSGAAGTSASPTYAIGAGEYRVEITQDSNPSCVTSELFTIAGPSDPITANTQVEPITCAEDGVIEIIDVLGGWGDYDYYVGTVAPTVAGDYSAAPRFDTLSAGTYLAWVIDQNGCQTEVQSNIVLSDPTPISADLKINQANCINFEGVIEVDNVLGGQGSNYTYQLIKDGLPIRAPQNTRVFSGLDAGGYEVQITDQWTCTFTTSPAEIIFEPITPLATVIKTIDCSTTDSGGQITITQTGGSGNFEYFVKYPDGIITAISATGIFTGLDQVGPYIFTVTDLDATQNCSTDIIQRLETAVIPLLSVDNSTNVTCNGADDGTIAVSVIDNGVGPYTFTIIAATGGPTTFPIAATSSTNTTAVFDGLEGSVGGITYTIEARGANNCPITNTATITELDAITIDPINIDQYGCTNSNNRYNAEVSYVNASGGTGTFGRFVFFRDGTEVQDGPNTSYFETDGLGGDYVIEAYDDAGCSEISAMDMVLPFFEISDPKIVTTQEAACSPLNKAKIQVGVTVTPTATPNLEYEVTGINVTFNQTNGTGTFIDLEFGNYSISITNLDTGCIINTVHKIDDPDVIEVVALKLSDELCLNDTDVDGSLEVAINNYSGNYDYQLFNISGSPIGGLISTDTSTPLEISDLPGGSYYVRVTATEFPSCGDDSNVITINSPSEPIDAIVREEANVTCSNDQGRILVDPTGGKGPYTITIASGTQTFTETNVSAFIFEGLSAGDFHVNVTDTFGCVLSDDIELIRPDDIVATITDTPLTCFDGNMASVTATVDPRNVTLVYQYRLNRYDALTGTTLLQTSAPQNGDTFSGLAAGFYSVTVTDEVSCSNETAIIEIVNPIEVEASLIRTSPLTCATGVEFELSATGGSGTYEYSTDNASWTAMAGNSVNLPLSGMLSAGVYQYYVRDDVNGCTSVISNSIEEDIIEPLTLIVDISAAVINCNGDNTAIIYADAEGGLGNYEYSLYTNASLSAASLVAGPQADGEFGGLPMGTYYVNVSSEDCYAPAEEVIITEPTPLVYTEDVVNVTCNGENDGSITIRLSGGAGGYQYAISPNLNRFDNENTFDELAAGDYTVIAQDRNGCFIELEYTINEPAVLEVSATALAEVCAGEENGSIELTITGGTAPYSTRLSSETNFVQGRTIFSDMASGSYIVFISDAMGCEENVSMTVDPGVNLNATVEPVYGCEDNITNNYINIVLNDPSISEEVLYALDSTDPADMQLNPYFRDITPGSHYIAVSHINGCIVTHSFEIENYEPLTIVLEQSNINEITATVNGGKEDYTIYFGDMNNGSDNTFMINRTDTYVVTVVDENGCEASANIFIEFIDIEIPNFFSPNGDAENQYWKPRNDEGFPQILTIIFDRYGREVYRIGPGDPGWDGFYQQNELPTGDYWYIIKLNGENDDREFVGHFTLYR